MRIFSLIGTVFMTGALITPLGGLNAQSSFQAAPATPHTQDIIQDTGVANRLGVAEVLRVLTQEVPAAACHLHHGVNVEDARALLAEGIDQTTELLEALLHGDIYWGITSPEIRRKTIAQIEALRADWRPIQEAGRRLLEDATQKHDLALVFQAAHPLFEKTSELLTMLDAQYSSSAEILARDVMYIRVSGRMTALNQAMALQACQLWSGRLDAAIAAGLKQSMQDYEGSLRALSDGLPALGILAPQTPGIAEKLDEIAALWEPNRTLLALVAAGEEISDQQRFDLYHRLIDERVALLDLVYLYQDHSKVMY